MRGWLEKFLECYTSNYRERDKHEKKKTKRYIFKHVYFF